MDSFEQRIMRFNFCADNPLFFNSGEVVMTLEDAFIDLLASQNFPGQGYTVNTAKNQLIINSPCAELGPFYTSDTFSTSIGLSWRYMPSSDRLGPITNTLFTLKEYVEQEFIGSTQYGIKSHQNSNNGNNNSGYPGDMPVKENETPSSNQYCLTVKPNPFEDKLYISFSGIKNSSTLIELTDVLGRFIGVICECKTDDTGRIQINVETEGLKPGVYCVRVKHQDKWFYYKIIKA